jgi:hypothetical protein
MTQGGVGQARSEGVRVAPERIDGGDCDLGPPLGALLVEPVDHDLPAAALHDVEEPTPGQVDDPGHVSGAPRAPDT